MEEQRHLVGRPVAGTEALESRCLFSTVDTLFFSATSEKRHLKHLRFRTLGEDQTPLRQFLVTSLTNIIHRLQVSDSIPLPNAQLRGLSLPQ